MTLQTLAMPSFQTFWWFSHVFHTFPTAPYFWERHHKQLIAPLNSPDEAQRGGPICTACTIIALASSKVTGAPCGFQAQSLSKTRLKCMSTLYTWKLQEFSVSLGQSKPCGWMAIHLSHTKIRKSRYFASRFTVEFWKKNFRPFGSCGHEMTSPSSV